MLTGTNLSHEEIYSVSIFRINILSLILAHKRHSRNVVCSTLVSIFSTEIAGTKKPAVQVWKQMRFTVLWSHYHRVCLYSEVIQPLRLMLDSFRSSLLEPSGRVSPGPRIGFTVLLGRVYALVLVHS